MNHAKNCKYIQHIHSSIEKRPTLDHPHMFKNAQINRQHGSENKNYQGMDVRASVTEHGKSQIEKLTIGYLAPGASRE